MKCDEKNTLRERNPGESSAPGEESSEESGAYVKIVRRSPFFFEKTLRRARLSDGQRENVPQPSLFLAPTQEKAEWEGPRDNK